MNFFDRDAILESRKQQSTPKIVSAVSQSHQPSQIQPNSMLQFQPSSKEIETVIEAAVAHSHPLVREGALKLKQITTEHAALKNKRQLKELSQSHNHQASVFAAELLLKNSAVKRSLKYRRQQAISRLQQQAKQSIERIEKASQRSLTVMVEEWNATRKALVSHVQQLQEQQKVHFSQAIGQLNRLDETFKKELERETTAGRSLYSGCQEVLDLLRSKIQL